MLPSFQFPNERVPFHGIVSYMFSVHYYLQSFAFECIMILSEMDRITISGCSHCTQILSRSFPVPRPTCCNTYVVQVSSIVQQWSCVERAMITLWIGHFLQDLGPSRSNMWRTSNSFEVSSPQLMVFMAGKVTTFPRVNDSH